MEQTREQHYLCQIHHGQRVLRPTAPRGQPPALTFEGVEMYAWADLHPTHAPPYATGAIVPNPLWHHLGCYNLAADGVSFESTPSFVLQRARGRP